MNLVEAFLRKLGLKPPPEPTPVPPLLEQGEFGDPAGQPEASLGIPTFNVRDLGLVDAELVAAKERLVSNLRKIRGEAKRAYLFANALEAPYLAVERVAEGPTVDALPPEPVPVPRRVLIDRLRQREQDERQAQKLAPLALTAAAERARAEQRAIAQAGSVHAYREQQLAAQRRAEKVAAYESEWRALAAAGDRAGRIWVEWQRHLQATTHAKTQLDAARAYASTPAARAAVQGLQEAYTAAKARSDAWARAFANAKAERDAFVARQQKAAGTHPLQRVIADLEAKRADQTQSFTVADNVTLQSARTRLEAL